MSKKMDVVVARMSPTISAAPEADDAEDKVEPLGEVTVKDQLRMFEVTREPRVPSVVMVPETVSPPWRDG
jgi:hypothetical protein